MKTFLIEFELPPLCAIYRDEIVAENGCEANRIFQEDNPKARIRKIEEVVENGPERKMIPCPMCEGEVPDCESCDGLGLVEDLSSVPVDLEDDFGDEPTPKRQCDVNGEECDSCQ